MPESRKGKTLVKGHTLLFEGRVSTYHGYGTGPGRGRCSCGAESETLPTTAARKRWHREHKDASVMTDRFCVCGHAHRQHEVRAGGLFGCYIAGCLCIDFAQRFEREDFFYDGKPMRGLCGYCGVDVDTFEKYHRVTSVVRGGRGVECVHRGDIEPSEGGPMQTILAADIEGWDKEHGPLPDGQAWSGRWDYDGTFRGAEAVNVPGFPVRSVRKPWEFFDGD